MLSWRLSLIGEPGPSTVDFPALTMRADRVLTVRVTGIPAGSTLTGLYLSAKDSSGVVRLTKTAAITKATDPAQATFTLAPDDVPTSLPASLTADAWGVLSGGANDGDTGPVWSGTIALSTPVTALPTAVASITVTVS